MCIWGYPPVILFFFINFPLSRLSFFFFFFFSGQITIRIDTLWAQLLLEFSTDRFETMYPCSTWSVDVHVVLGLASRFFFFFVVVVVLFCFRLSFFLLFRLSFSRFDYSLNRYLVGVTPPRVFPPIILKLCVLVLHHLKMCSWFRVYRLLSFHHFFYFYDLVSSWFD